MKYKIIVIGGFCFVVVFALAIAVATYLGEIIGDQRERNYYRFVQNADGLTNTFREPVEDCAIKKVKQQDEGCIKKIDEEYRIQFGSLIKLFGYEAHIKELYPYWKIDLQYWYEAKKIELKNLETLEVVELKIKQISDIRNQAVNDRLQPKFVAQVESDK